MNDDTLESKPIKKPQRNYFVSGGYKVPDEKKPPKLTLAPIDRTTSGNNNSIAKEAPPPTPKLHI